MQTISIPEEICNTLKTMTYEVEARKSILTGLIERGLNTTESFQTYHKEYVDLFAAYETIKNDLETKYVMPILKANERATWALNFATNEIIYELIKEEAQEENILE